VEPVHWFDNTTVPQAIDQARSTGKPLLVDFWSPTCKGCAKLFAVTYPDPAVRALLGQCFVCVKFNTTTPNAWFKRLKGSFGHLWHPNIAILDDRLTEARRFIGFLPPDDFIAQLEVGRGLVELYHARAQIALDIFNRVTEQGEHTHVAPEALYWAGVAAYRAGGGLEALTTIWSRIEERYPLSEWAMRADCLDVCIPPAGFSMADPQSVQLVARVGATHAG
jgi:thiol-disulfide isomerase/thioredoxin